MGRLDFTVLQRSSTTQARRGRLVIPHGVVETPVFMPVGTLGAVKGLDATDMETLDAGIMLANAYHLLLRPGSALVERRGGLHRFLGHSRGILTDSGGFQVFSLAPLRSVTDAGVRFRSHVDGTLIELSPERLVAVQEQLGPDIAMVLDECPPARADRETVGRAMDRTTLWARRAVRARRRDDVSWFGIVQGATYEDLRTEHAAQLGSLPFDGMAIGGVSVGEDADDIARIVQHTAPMLPPQKPRYLMGVGTPADLVRGVAAGVDMFDCVMPSRNARNGQLFTWEGRINIKHAAWREHDGPLDDACGCHTCRRFSRAYLRHLFIAKEITFCRLATLHNIWFYLDVMRRIRRDIEADTFAPASLSAQLELRAA